MATHDSKQIQQWEAVGHAPLKPNELYGRVRIAYGQFQADRDVSGGAAAQNDNVRMVTIPKGARLVGGTVKHGAFGASVTLDIGLRGADLSGYLSADGSTTADDPDGVATNVDISAAGSFDLFEELGFLYFETEKETELMFLFEGANPADNVQAEVSVLYVVD